MITSEQKTQVSEDGKINNDLIQDEEQILGLDPSLDIDLPTYFTPSKPIEHNESTAEE